MNGKVTQIRPEDIEMVPMPKKVAEALRKFLVDSKSGNFMLNVRNGEVLGFHQTEIVSLSRRAGS